VDVRLVQNAAEASDAAIDEAIARLTRSLTQAAAPGGGGDDGRRHVVVAIGDSPLLPPRLQACRRAGLATVAVSERGAPLAAGADVTLDWALLAGGGYSGD